MRVLILQFTSAYSYVCMSKHKDRFVIILCMLPHCVWLHRPWLHCLPYSPGLSLLSHTEPARSLCFTYKERVWRWTTPMTCLDFPGQSALLQSRADRAKKEFEWSGTLSLMAVSSSRLRWQWRQPCVHVSSYSIELSLCFPLFIAKLF